MDEVFLPVYELSLRSNEPLTSKTSAVPLGHSDSARVRCSLSDSGFESHTLLLTRNQKNMTYNRRGHSILHTVDKFDSNRGEELFDCTARRRDGKIQVRSMKFVRSRKQRISNGDKECEVNHCRNNGICLTKEDGMSKYCMCADNYMGTMCEQSFATLQVLEDNINVKNHRTLLSGLAIILIFVLIAIAVLYFLERKKTRKLKNMVRELTKNQNIASTKSKNDVDLEALGCEDPDPDLEEIYDQADQKPAIRRPTVINDYDNLKLKPEDSSGKRPTIT